MAELWTGCSNLGHSSLWFNLFWAGFLLACSRGLLPMPVMTDMTLLLSSPSRPAPSSSPPSPRTSTSWSLSETENKLQGVRYHMAVWKTISFSVAVITRLAKCSHHIAYSKYVYFIYNSHQIKNFAKKITASWINLVKYRGKLRYLPRKVLQMYSDIWLPDLDSEKWLSSLFNIRLN